MSESRGTSAVTAPVCTSTSATILCMARLAESGPVRGRSALAITTDPPSGAHTTFVVYHHGVPANGCTCPVASSSTTYSHAGLPEVCKRNNRSLYPAHVAGATRGLQRSSATSPLGAIEKGSSSSQSL